MGLGRVGPLGDMAVIRSEKERAVTLAMGRWRGRDDAG
jgi:hypothetical protein